MPLPDRIPSPLPEQRVELESMGVIIDYDSAKDETHPGYLSYTVPDGWQVVDAGHKPELPDYRMIDENGVTRVIFRGVWNGALDNELYLIIPADHRQ